MCLLLSCSPPPLGHVVVLEAMQDNNYAAIQGTEFVVGVQWGQGGVPGRHGGSQGHRGWPSGGLLADEVAFEFVNVCDNPMQGLTPPLPKRQAATQHGLATSVMARQTVLRRWRGFTIGVSPERVSRTQSTMGHHCLEIGLCQVQVRTLPSTADGNGHSGFSQTGRLLIAPARINARTVVLVWLSRSILLLLVLLLLSLLLCLMLLVLFFIVFLVGVIVLSLLCLLCWATWRSPPKCRRSSRKLHTACILVFCCFP